MFNCDLENTSELGMIEAAAEKSLKNIQHASRASAERDEARESYFPAMKLFFLNLVFK